MCLVEVLQVSSRSAADDLVVVRSNLFSCLQIDDGLGAISCSGVMARVR